MISFIRQTCTFEKFFRWMDIATRQAHLEAIDCYHNVDSVKGRGNKTMKLEIETEKMGLKKEVCYRIY